MTSGHPGNYTTLTDVTWRISNALEADFCVEALNEAIHKFGPPEIMNTDSHMIDASSRPLPGPTD